MFDALGPVAQAFHVQLCQRPVKTVVHLRRVLRLVRLHGRQEVLAAVAQALQYQTCDAAYVETILLQERRRRELPSPTPLRPERRELIEEIELGEPDSSGRRRPILLPGTECVLEVDAVIEAMGQGIPADLREALDELEFTNQHLVTTLPDSQATTLPGVFAGGDLVNGGTTAVRAIREGMDAADEIDQLLSPA